MVGHSWHNCPNNGKGSTGSNKGGGHWNSNWNSSWNGFRGKGGASVWATEWGEWGQHKEEYELKFGNQAADPEDEPQEEADLGAVDNEDELAVNMKDEHVYHIKPICHIKPQHIYHINPPQRILGQACREIKADLSTITEFP